MSSLSRQCHQKGGWLGGQGEGGGGGEGWGDGGRRSEVADAVYLCSNFYAFSVALTLPEGHKISGS